MWAGITDMGGPGALLAGLRLRCPACGRGRLFANYLKVAPRCAACDLDFSRVDSGDGPAFFVILIVGAIVMPGVLLVELAWAPEPWVQAALWFPITIGLVLALLPPLKGALIALQFMHGAGPGRLDDDGAP